VQSALRKNDRLTFDSPWRSLFTLPCARAHSHVPTRPWPGRWHSGRWKQEAGSTAGWDNTPGLTMTITWASRRGRGHHWLPGACNTGGRHARLIIGHNFRSARVLSPIVDAALMWRRSLLSLCSRSAPSIAFVWCNNRSLRHPSAVHSFRKKHYGGNTPPWDYFNISQCTGWPKKVSRYQESSLNRIKNRQSY